MSDSTKRRRSRLPAGSPVAAKLSLQRPQRRQRHPDRETGVRPVPSGLPDLVRGPSVPVQAIPHGVEATLGSGLLGKLLGLVTHSAHSAMDVGLLRVTRARYEEAEKLRAAARKDQQQQQRQQVDDLKLLWQMQRQKLELLQTVYEQKQILVKMRDLGDTRAVEVEQELDALLLALEQDDSRIS